MTSSRILRYYYYVDVVNNADTTNKAAGGRTPGFAAADPRTCHVDGARVHVRRARRAASRAQRMAGPLIVQLYGGMRLEPPGAAPTIGQASS